MAEVTLHAYRRRWRPEPSDQRYGALEARLRAVETIAVSALMIQGGDD